MKLRYFETSLGKNNVIDHFVRRQLKNRPEVARALVRHLEIIVASEVGVLRRRGILEFVRGDVFSYRFKVPAAGNLWIRLLAAIWPGDGDLVILAALVKKRNDIPPSDIRQAERNLRILENTWSIVKI